MTESFRKLSISVPPDVAETLESQGKGKASAYVTGAVRAQRAWEDFRDEQARRGVILTEEGMAAARARRYAVQAEWTPERIGALRQQVREHMESELSGGDQQAPAA
ncbi:hypothetical protein QTQ03_05835 [Micromonospora sp. WMMA1363]|uniref:hypothetical protein n=1 Tax=Micromonospora sp. WMMA1363 TaxID=3053985 RepID=UPI00259CA088|nr:hypothetical protein [Micromonospora sp. WMMA1363]MDM4719140.1 hypothetical protein [Micromonospora sp. WMMA1363]